MLRMLPLFLAFLQCPNCFLRIRFCGFLGQVQRDVIEQQLILVFFPLLSLSLPPSLSLTFFRSIVHNVCVYKYIKHKTICLNSNAHFL